MLVVYRIELVLVHEPHEMRELHRDHAVRLEHGFHASDEIVEVGNLSQHIVADQQVHPAVLRGELLGRIAAKEFDDRPDSLLLRNCRDICRWLDAYGPDPFLNEVLEKITV